MNDSYRTPTGHMLIAIVLSLSTVPACGGGPETTDQSADVTEGEASPDLEAAFAEEMEGARKDAENRRRGACSAPQESRGTADGAVKESSLFPLAVGALPKSVCAALRPFRAMEHPYYFIGSFLSASAGPGVQGGVDLVWDLENLQAAAFSYKGVVYSSGVALTAGVYQGFALSTTRKANVLDAWSGVFHTASGSIGLKGLLSGDLSYFDSPADDQGGVIRGVSVGISAGLTPVPAPVGVTVAPSTEWQAWDAVTSSYDDETWDCVFGKTLRSIAYGKKRYKVVQFTTTRGLAAAILWRAGALGGGVLAAGYVAALGALKATGMSISQACPGS